jgi:hypothetical protein
VPESETFDANETVELVGETMSLQNWTALWDKLKPKIQTYVTYVARMVPLESSEGLVVTAIRDAVKKPYCIEW